MTAPNKDLFVTITTDEIPEYISMAWDTFQKTGKPPIILLEGPPGSGKTHMAHVAANKVASKYGKKLVSQPAKPLTKTQFGFWVTQFANSSEEVISGLPWADKDKNIQMRAMVRSFPQSGPGIWFCDEPLQAAYTQRFLAQLVYGGKLDDYYTMPENVMIVMAGNSSKDRAGVSRMWSHFQNRLTLLRVQPEVEGALANFNSPVQPEVAVYLRWFPEKLHMFDPRKEGPFPSGRVWDFVNDLLYSGANPEDHFPLFQGYLGHDEAAEFRACFSAIRNLPDISKILGDPEAHSTWIKKKWRSNPQTITALSFLMLKKLRERELDLTAKAIRVFEIAGPEQAAAYLAIAKEIDAEINDGKSLHDSKEYAAFAKRNPRLLAG